MEPKGLNQKPLRAYKTTSRYQGTSFCALLDLQYLAFILRVDLFKLHNSVSEWLKEASSRLTLTLKTSAE